MLWKGLQELSTLQPVHQSSSITNANERRSKFVSKFDPGAASQYFHSPISQSHQMYSDTGISSSRNNYRSRCLLNPRIKERLEQMRK